MLVSKVALLMRCHCYYYFRGKNGPGGYKMIPVDNNNTQLIWLCNTNLKVWLLIVMVMLTCMLLGLFSIVPHQPNSCYHDNTGTQRPSIVHHLITEISFCNFHVFYKILDVIMCHTVTFIKSN